MNILEKILADKKEEVHATLGSIGPSLLEKNQNDHRIPLDFKGALQNRSLSIIAEVKKASPSKGLIRPDFNPVDIAASYIKNGANCLSILTEIKYFQGHPDYLKSIRKIANIPLLRKDFMVDARQIRESYELGADAVLLIVGALSPEKLTEFKTIADSFGLTCLVEVHSEEELQIALNINCDLIGINNRNLTTLETDVKHSAQLKSMIPNGLVTVSESGIHTAEDCQFLKEKGFDAILVGETLMRQPDPGLAIVELMRKVQ